MYAILMKARGALDATFGRCPRCMRQSFLAALGAWALVVAVWLIIGGNAITDASAIAALGVTALWIAHLVAYAGRSVVALMRLRDRGTRMMSRREIIHTFARALGAIALTTALPVATTFAQNRCDCSKCSSSQSCCPTANWYCGCFPFSCP